MVWGLGSYVDVLSTSYISYTLSSDRFRTSCVALRTDMQTIHWT